MNFKNAIVNSIRDDIVKHKILITVEIDRNELTLSVAEELSLYAGKDPQDVEVVITPRQIRLFPSKED